MKKKIEEKINKLIEQNLKSWRKSEEISCTKINTKKVEDKVRKLKQKVDEYEESYESTR